jgi:hypothetical protein
MRLPALAHNAIKELFLAEDKLPAQIARTTATSVQLDPEALMGSLVLDRTTGEYSDVIPIVRVMILRGEMGPVYARRAGTVETE